MASSETRILIVDADQDAAQRMGLALDGAGFQVAWCTFSPQDFQSMSKDFAPSLLFVHADLGSAQLTTLLARVDAAGAATVPEVLLCTSRYVTTGSAWFIWARSAASSTG
jgi:DNA-binding response OmpR family regulator